jgi:hypothetical protein
MWEGATTAGGSSIFLASGGKGVGHDHSIRIRKVHSPSSVAFWQVVHLFGLGRLLAGSTPVRVHLLGSEHLLGSVHLLGSEHRLGSVHLLGGR